MQAILMVGGKGTRLRPFTNILPKPLVPVGDLSILELVLHQLKYFGFRKIHLCVGHKAELIMAVIGDGTKYGVEVAYHLEDVPLGTMGALPSVAPLDDHFLVMNGDVCTNLDFGKFMKHHISSGALATVSTYRRTEKIELGIVHEEPTSNRIVSFEEKPTYNWLVSMGVNAFSKDILSYVPLRTHFGFDDLLHRLLEQGTDVRSVEHQGLWHDIGRPDDYQTMLDDFSNRPYEYLRDGTNKE